MKAWLRSECESNVDKATRKIECKQIDHNNFWCNDTSSALSGRASATVNIALLQFVTAFQLSPMSTSNAVPSSHINDITDLDPLLQPVWRHYTRKELMQFNNIPPFDELPAPFVPDRRRPLKPPLMYFGWKIDMDEWLKYAERHGFIVMEHIMHLDGVDEATFDDQGFDDDNVPDIIVIEEVDKYLSVAEVFWSFLSELGITPYTDFILKCSMGIGGSRTMLALRDNYKDNSTLTSDRLQDLQKKLKQPDPPKWYPIEPLPLVVLAAILYKFWSNSDVGSQASATAGTCQGLTL
ncbi:hypothetical protein EW026_g7312 [Hermanssonia centrifuga]|uniref:Uncharacterized protein n=1 Tax=Hermanssonia centrifuga TaxID=98765 RepID=A0A4S4KA18_9APHY|nr:hypothetical protein EW026_g7312 [Hermanssonia centrifuga]